MDHRGYRDMDSDSNMKHSEIKENHMNKNIIGDESLFLPL